MYVYVCVFVRARARRSVNVQYFTNCSTLEGGSVAAWVKHWIQDQLAFGLDPRKTNRFSHVIKLRDNKVHELKTAQGFESVILGIVPIITFTVHC